eukprot:3273530-Prorocentrum_lima.AAC.1
MVGNLAPPEHLKTKKDAHSKNLRQAFIHRNSKPASHQALGLAQCHHTPTKLQPHPNPSASFQPGSER